MKETDDKIYMMKEDIIKDVHVFKNVLVSWLILPQCLCWLASLLLEYWLCICVFKNVPMKALQTDLCSFWSGGLISRDGVVPVGCGAELCFWCWYVDLSLHLLSVKAGSQCVSRSKVGTASYTVIKEITKGPLRSWFDLFSNHSRLFFNYDCAVLIQNKNK